MQKQSSFVQTKRRYTDTALPDYWSVPLGYVEPEEEIKQADFVKL